MAEIWLTSWGTGSLSHYLQGFIHPRWLFGISSINSITIIMINLNPWIMTSRITMKNQQLMHQIYDDCSKEAATCSPYRSEWKTNKKCKDANCKYSNRTYGIMLTSSLLIFPRWERNPHHNVLSYLVSRITIGFMVSYYNNGATLRYKHSKI